MEVINTSRCTHRWRHLCIRGCMFLRVRDSCCDIFRGWNILSLEYYARSWCAVPIVLALMKLSYFSSLCLSLFVLKPLFLIMQECMFPPPPPLFTQGSVTENDEQSYPGTPYSALSLLHILKPEFDRHMPSHAGSCVCAHTHLACSSYWLYFCQCDNLLEVILVSCYASGGFHSLMKRIKCMKTLLNANWCQRVDRSERSDVDGTTSFGVALYVFLKVTLFIYFCDLILPVDFKIYHLTSYTIILYTILLLRCQIWYKPKKTSKSCNLE